MQSVTCARELRVNRSIPSSDLRLTEPRDKAPRVQLVACLLSLEELGVGHDAKPCRKSCEIELAMRPMVANLSASISCRWLSRKSVRMLQERGGSLLTLHQSHGLQRDSLVTLPSARTASTRLPSGRVKVWENKNTMKTCDSQSSKCQRQQ